MLISYSHPKGLVLLPPPWNNIKLFVSRPRNHRSPPPPFPRPPLVPFIHPSSVTSLRTFTFKSFKPDARYIIQPLRPRDADFEGGSSPLFPYPRGCLSIRPRHRRKLARETTSIILRRTWVLISISLRPFLPFSNPFRLRERRRQRVKPRYTLVRSSPYPTPRFTERRLI